MKSYKLSCLLLFSYLVHWNSVDALCSLRNQTLAHCHDLEDARYIDTYQLQVLRAPSFSKVLLPGNFRNLTTLRHLDLSGGKIEKIKSGSFAELTSLQMLSLAENQIEILQAGAFDGLEQLHTLKFEDNKIKRLPEALKNLKGLKLLDLSNNPLYCDCASLKLRDVLLAKGVRISKKTKCDGPHSVFNMTILKPNTKEVCDYEIQDHEMQGDQPAESNKDGSGETENEAEEEETPKILDSNKETDSKEEGEEKEEETTPATSAESPSSSSLSMSDEIVSQDATTTSTSAPTEDEVSKDMELDSKINQSTISETNSESSSSAKPKVADVSNEAVKSEEEGDSKEVNNSKELDQLENVNKNVDSEKTEGESPDITEIPLTSSVSTESEKINMIIPDEGSGDVEDDGSGSDTSGLIDHMPGIDFNSTHEVADDEESQNVLTSSTTPETTWADVPFGLINSLFFGPSETEKPNISSTTTSVEDDLKEEQLIKVTENVSQSESAPVDEEVTLQPRILLRDEASKQSSRSSLALPNNDLLAGHENKDNALDLALDSKEAKQGMGSYYVLATLLAVLAVLIIIAAYKGDFCRKKQKRRDVERGTEMKDMQKSLLDQNTMQPKIQVSNGTTLENVPLMNSSAPPEEPKDNQKSYDVNPAVVTNGSSKPNGTTTDASDPVKPPRKVMGYEIEAPLNGLNPPMDDIDGPTSPCLHNGSNENLDSDSYDGKPSLSPGAQKVMITMQDNPDSVPKTPILITRLQGGENLVKTP